MVEVALLEHSLLPTYSPTTHTHHQAGSWLGLFWFGWNPLKHHCIPIDLPADFGRQASATVTDH